MAMWADGNAKECHFSVFVVDDVVNDLVAGESSASFFISISLTCELLFLAITHSNLRRIAPPPNDAGHPS